MGAAVHGLPRVMASRVVCHRKPCHSASGAREAGLGLGLLGGAGQGASSSRPPAKTVHTTQQLFTQGTQSMALWRLRLPKYIPLYCSA